MRHKLAAAGLAAALAAVAASVSEVPGGTNGAMPEQAVFLVPADDGYGVAECLSSGADCGRAVADSWCETQGFGGAVSFGRHAPGEGTARVQTAAAGRTEQQQVAVTCRR